MASIIVIGSGFGGLGAAVRLVGQGHDVTVVEKRDQPGGRGYVFRQDGFTFDGGPTVITAPWMFDELFEAAGGTFPAEVELVPIDPFYRIFFDDRTRLDYAAQLDQMLENIRELTGSDRDADGYIRMLAQTEKIFDKGFVELADQPFLNIQDMIRVAPDLAKLGSHLTVYQLVQKYIRDDKLRQAFSFHPLLVGGNPFQATSVYALIHHLEREWGIWFAMGGTGAIIDAMVALFESSGGNLMLNSTVEEIIIEDGWATGVRLDNGSVLGADIVVSNADIATTYKKMIPAAARPSHSDEKLESMRYSMSLVVIYFGTDRQYRGEDGPELAHHNIILGPRYQGLLDDIFTNKILSEDFSLYLHMPTLTDPSLAPEGHEAFYVLAPVPHLGSGIDWEFAAKPYRHLIMNFLEREYLPGLSEHIVTERMIDPRYFEQELDSELGSAFSFEPVLMQSAWFRPHNRDQDIPNLFFAGAGTHPGAGVPGVLSSAKIVSDLIGQAS